MQQDTLRELRKLSGKEFDRQYIEDMLRDHREDVNELQGTIPTIQTIGIKALMTKMLPILENHLRIAEHAAGRIGVSPKSGLNEPEHPAS